MNRGPDPKPNEYFVPECTLEAADDDLSDIDPADFIDPEDFGTKQRV